MEFKTRTVRARSRRRAVWVVYGRTGMLLLPLGRWRGKEPPR